MTVMSSRRGLFEPGLFPSPLRGRTASTPNRVSISLTSPSPECDRSRTASRSLACHPLLQPGPSPPFHEPVGVDHQPPGAGEPQQPLLPRAGLEDARHQRPSPLQQPRALRIPHDARRVPRVHILQFASHDIHHAADDRHESVGAERPHRFDQHPHDPFRVVSHGAARSERGFHHRRQERRRRPRARAHPR